MQNEYSGPSRRLPTQLVISVATLGNVLHSKCVRFADLHLTWSSVQGRGRTNADASRY